MALTTAVLLFVAARAFTPDAARIEVDLDVSAGSAVSLFVNDLTRPPLSRPIEPGTRQRYVFDGIIDDIAMLRLDPSDASAATIQLYSVTVSTRGGILAQFDAPTLAGWTRSGLSMESVDATRAGFRSTTTDPILTTRVSIPLSGTRSAWTSWLPMVNEPDFTWRLGTLGVGFLLLFAAVTDRHRRRYAVVLLAAVVLVIAALAAYNRLPDGPGSATVAISRATIVGLSTIPALVVSAGLIAGALATGMAAALPWRRRLDVIEAPRPVLQWWQILLAVLVIGIAHAPELRSWAATLATTRYVPHWDQDNLVYWSYLIQEGRWPFRDFWYPYGGAATFELAFPIGPVVRWLYLTTLFGLLFVVVGRWRGALVASIVTFTIFAGISIGTLPAADRYLLAPLVVLAYATADRDTAKGRVLFWASVALALFIEPPQLIYAAVSVALILTVQAAERWSTSRDDFGRWLVTRLRDDFGVPAALLAIMLGVLAVTGQLAGVVEMYSRLGDAVAYSTWPAGLPPLAIVPLPRIAMFMTCITALVAVGAYEYFQGPSRRVYAEVTVGIGLVAFMVLQKHFMRWMDDQLLIFALIAAVLFTAGWPGIRRRSDYVAWGLVLGTFIAMLAARPAAATMFSSLADAPARSVRSMSYLLTGKEDARRVRAERFVPERFEVYHLERRAANIINSRTSGSTASKIFALTDEMPMYVLVGQKSTWISNMYDASPLYRQKRVVEWLRRERPPFAVFSLDHLIFDQFQLALRVPLVYAEVVADYVPLDTDTKMQVLQRRSPDQPIAMAYWRDRLGSDLYVGRLTSVSSYGKQSCTTGCGDLLEVRLPPGGSGNVAIPVAIDGVPFSVTFTRVADETTYRLLLDRIWFWNAAGRAGLVRTLPDRIEGNGTVKVLKVDVSSGALY